MARKRASMREGPLAELFRATEAAQRQAEQEPAQRPADEVAPATEPDERTVDHVPSWEESTRVEQSPVSAPPPAPPPPRHDPTPTPPAPEPPVARYVDPMPEQLARLHRVPRGD